jgi:DNA repair photolyase
MKIPRINWNIVSRSEPKAPQASQGKVKMIAISKAISQLGLPTWVSIPPIFGLSPVALESKIIKKVNINVRKIRSNPWSKAAFAGRK